MPAPDAPATVSPARRWLMFGVMLAGFTLGFFHRTAPASIAGELTRAFDIPAAVLGSLAATYFLVYMLLQVPVGIVADTLGPRILMSVGALVAAAGSLVFALAPSWPVAAVGRTLVGAGVSVAFIATLKVIAVWFPVTRFATLVGVTMFAGNLGAVLAGAPLAWVIGHVSWRSVFVGLAVATLAVAVAAWAFVRDRPPVQASVGGAPSHPRLDWVAALRDVLRKPATWAGLLVTTGIGGSFLAFAGLWGAPYMMDVHRVSRVVAAQHVSLLVVGVAIGSFVIGAASDRLGNRLAFMRGYAVLYVLTWIPWVVGVRWPVVATLAWYLLMGLLIPAFTLALSLAKEGNRPEHSGIATAVVNVGGFLGAGLLQPLVGWRIDVGRAAGDLQAGWSQGILLFAGAALIGLLAALGHPRPAPAHTAGREPRRSS